MSLMLEWWPTHWCHSFIAFWFLKAALHWRRAEVAFTMQMVYKSKWHARNVMPAANKGARISTLWPVHSKWGLAHLISFRALQCQWGCILVLANGIAQVLLWGSYSEKVFVLSGLPCLPHPKPNQNKNPNQPIKKKPKPNKTNQPNKYERFVSLLLAQDAWQFCFRSYFQILLNLSSLTSVN